MTRHATATALLDARGAFKKDPQRKRVNEPKPEGEFPKQPPAHLTAEQRETWHELVRAINKMPGVLQSCDDIIVEMAACLFAEFRRDPDAMPAARIGRLEAQIGRLGLSPADRAKLSIQKSKANEFDDV